MKKRTIVRPFLALVLVLILALSLLIYIASVDAFQSYSGFLLDRINSSAEIVEQTVESLLQAGLSLPQLVGFDVITTAILSSDDLMHDISVIDNTDTILFQNSKQGFEISELDEYDTRGGYGNGDYTVYRSSDSFQIRVPLEGRFDTPGSLLVTMPVSVVSQLINRHLSVVILFALAVVFVYAIVLLVLLKKRKVTAVGLNIIYNVSVLVVSCFLIGSLTQIYSNGVQQKARALAISLSARLGTIFDLGLDLDDVDGIDDVFADYKRLNSDISFISLTENDMVIAHTDLERVSQPYEADVGSIEYRQDINTDLGIAISVAIPRRAIFSRLARNIKNFAVLFFAFALLSWLLLRILFSVYPDIRSDLVASPLSRNSRQVRALLDLIFPAFFLANFLEGLHYSYLPQFLSQLAVDSGLSGSRVGGVYALYWAMYALVLIPAGRSARTIDGIRRLLLTGFILIASSMVLLVVLQQFGWIYLIRAIAGLGQGMVFIAVQSYILQESNEDQRTEGISIIVYGYNGGVISGTIIGALLVPSFGVNRLLLISAAIAVLMIWYSVAVIGKSKKSRTVASGEEPGLHIPSAETRQSLYTHGPGGGLPLREGFMHRIKVLFSDTQFTRTILFVGLITKAVLAGVAFLALPHLLSNLNYRQEDVGQILMFYAAGVLLVSRLIARYTDRIGNTRLILFFGSLCSAIGLAIIASANLVSHIFIFQTIMLVGGILILGLSHGFIHAPIVTHITRLPVSNVLRKTVVASAYRFLERIGHVLGPLVFGYFLLRPSAGIGSIYYVAIAVGVSSLLFYFLPMGKRGKNIDNTYRHI